MLLSVPLSVLLSPHWCQQYCDYAGELLKIFVQNFGDIYGKQYVTYNVHATVHLADEAKVHGPLDSIAGFPFENCLGKLKKLIRKPHAHLQQVVRRLSERRVVMHSVPADVLLHSLGPVPLEFGSCIQYKEYHHRDYRVTLSHKDNCVLIGKCVGIVRNFLAVGSDKFVVFSEVCSVDIMLHLPTLLIPCFWKCTVLLILTKTCWFLHWKIYEKNVLFRLQRAILSSCHLFTNVN